jgi:hypothetical protein
MCSRGQPLLLTALTRKEKAVPQSRILTAKKKAMEKTLRLLCSLKVHFRGPLRDFQVVSSFGISVRMLSAFLVSPLWAT